MLPDKNTYDFLVGAMQNLAKSLIGFASIKGKPHPNTPTFVRTHIRMAIQHAISAWDMAHEDEYVFTPDYNFDLAEEALNQAEAILKEKKQ